MKTGIEIRDGGGRSARGDGIKAGATPVLDGEKEIGLGIPGSKKLQRFLIGDDPGNLRAGARRIVYGTTGNRGIGAGAKTKKCLPCDIEV